MTDVETVADRAFGLFASCTGSGAAFAARCAELHAVVRARPGADDWTPVGASTSGLKAGTAGAASLVLTGSRGYLLAPDGMLYAGPVDRPRAVAPGHTDPVPGRAAAGRRQQAGALLAAQNAANLGAGLRVVKRPGAGQAKSIFTSADGGISWQDAGAGPALGLATSVAASPAGAYLLATSRGIDVRPAGSATWQPAALDGPEPKGGFGFVGMTTDAQGIALPANSAAGTIWFSYDGGLSWRPVTVSGT